MKKKICSLLVALALGLSSGLAASSVHAESIYHPDEGPIPEPELKPTMNYEQCIKECDGNPGINDNVDGESGLMSLGCYIKCWFMY